MGEMRRGRSMLGVAALVVAVMAAGCGGDDGDDAQTTSRRAAAHVRADRYSYARGLFNELCAGCHNLDDAGARGQRYDLDRSPGLNAAQVWNAIQNGEPGMPAWGASLSNRELTALAVYVTNVAKHSSKQEPGWSKQFSRRYSGGTERWQRIAKLVSRELEREGREGEGPAGRVLPPEEETEG
jgi:mono/diheme cytochrome c family protein